MNTSIEQPAKGASPGSETSTPDQGRVENDLDEALDKSFPASDPVSVPPESVSDEGEEDALDEALKESFPASDPASPTQPG